MTLEEIKENLCYYDYRNPDCSLTKEESLEYQNKFGESECYCDNCFYGKTVLAKELLKITIILNNKNKRF